VAAARLRQVLDEAGRTDTDIQITVITPENLATKPAFAGSPTVLLDGTDPFTEVANPETGISCRVYPSAQGSAGAPSLDALRHAINH
jgi:hypothetical protein